MQSNHFSGGDTIMKKRMAIPTLLACLALMGLLSCKPRDTEIRFGGVFDLTGPTSETGNHYARGVKEYIQYVNSQGGINGRKIVLFSHDTAYVKSRDRAAYDDLITRNRVHLIIGWGTGSTEELVSRITSDEIPYTGVSYSEKLGNPAYAPYNFLTSASYSDQIRIVLAYIKKNWNNPARAPRVALIYNETEFGSSPIPDGKAYAAKIGIDISGEEIVTLEAQEAFEQLGRIKANNTDFVIIQETAWATSVIIKNAKKMGLKTRFIGLSWSGDDKLVALAGSAAEGFMGVFPVVYDDANIPGLKIIRESFPAGGQTDERINLRYINGWTAAMIMLEGVKRAGDDISGPSIKKGLESMRDFDTGGLTYPVSYSSTSHKGILKLKIGVVKDGSWKMITGFVSADNFE
jgi:branched-chain amino acid transport system substrate-binding protein